MSSEPERYELGAGPVWRFEVNRREWFELAGCGIAVLVLARELPGQESGGGRRRGGRGSSAPQEIDAWLHIGEDGSITVYTGKAEVGQNIRTSLAQAVAEELRVPLASVSLVMGDTARTPYDMGTFGSRTTPTMSPQLRKAAAAAREVLLDLAAEVFKADRASLTAANAKITNSRSGEARAFGELAHGQKLLRTIPADAPLTPASEWQVAGKPAAKANGRDFVTGRHKYSSDVHRPGMQYGKVLRPPAVGASLVSVSAGVKFVRDGDFVGVVAPSERGAEQALAAIHAEWRFTPQPSGAGLFDYLKSTAKSSGPEHAAVSATYTVAYIAHAPLEPRAAVAQWEGDKLTVWTGTQRPFGVRGELAEAFRIPESNVRVIVPDTGAAYGGKHTGEAAVEAARLARAAGTPVKLVWTRQEEFTHAYFRPAGVIEVSSSVDKNGRLTAWEFHNYNSGGSAIQTPYDVANQRCEFHNSRSPLRQGSYRGLAATANTFAREMHMDELARSAGLDPLEFRLRNLKNARLRAVLEAASKTFGWPVKAAPGRGYGIACGTEKGGYTATCAEVAVDRSSGAVRVVRVAQAFECGAVVNPDGLRNQNEGAIVMGIGGALLEAIEFDEGRILNPRFSRYHVPRFHDVPAIDVVLVDRRDLPPAGAGESPIIGIAPAIGNAIFDATGVRLRSLPMSLPRAKIS